MRARQMLPIVTLLQLAEVPSTMSAALKAEDIFNPADFQSMETFFTKIKNLTTNTEPESLQDVHIMEIGDRSLAFDIDKNCGAKGHSLNIILKLVCPTKPGVPAKSVVFEANTTIRATEQLDDGVIATISSCSSSKRKIGRNSSRYSNPGKMKSMNLSLP